MKKILVFAIVPLVVFSVLISCKGKEEAEEEPQVVTIFTAAGEEQLKIFEANFVDCKRH